MIVVTAPTGQIGRQVLANVLAAGQQARVVVRDAAKLPAGVRERVEVVEGSHGDPGVLERALDGADALFWLLPTNVHAPSVDEAFSGFTRPAAEVIRSQGVGRIVDVTALGRGTAYEEKAGYVTGSLRMDDLLASTGAAVRGLAAASFMDNMLRQVPSLKEHGVYFDALTPDVALPTVATRDIAAVAARLLLDDSWDGHGEVSLLGPENLSPQDLCAIMSDVLGTAVRYQRMPDAEFKARFLGHGMSEAMAQGMLDMAVAKDNGLDLGVTRTPHHAADTPTTFRQWCDEVLEPAFA